MQTFPSLVMPDRYRKYPNKRDCQYQSWCKVEGAVSGGVVIRAIHTAVRGRARYTVPGLYGSEALKKRLEFRLGACDGILDIAASTRTGNVLVRFQPDLSVEAVAAVLGNVLAEHANAIRSRNRTPRTSVSANGARPATPHPAT